MRDSFLNPGGLPMMYLGGEGGPGGGGGGRDNEDEGSVLDDPGQTPSISDPNPIDPDAPGSRSGGGQSRGEQALGSRARGGRTPGEVALGGQIAEAAAAGLGPSGSPPGTSGPDSGVGGREGGGGNRLTPRNERRRAAPVQAETPEEQQERVRRAVVVLGIPGSLANRANTLF